MKDQLAKGRAVAKKKATVELSRKKWGNFIYTPLLQNCIEYSDPRSKLMRGRYLAALNDYRLETRVSPRRKISEPLSIIGNAKAWCNLLLSRPFTGFNPIVSAQGCTKPVLHSHVSSVPGPARRTLAIGEPHTRLSQQLLQIVLQLKNRIIGQAF